MKTNALMIPLALLIMSLLHTMGFAMTPPQTKLFIEEENYVNSLDNMERETYPLLSTKDYEYESVDNMVLGKDLIVFDMDNYATIYIHIDENGNYSKRIEYYASSEKSEELEVVKETKKSNVFESMRSMSRELLHQASDYFFHNSETKKEVEIVEPTQNDKKYFNSDYRDEIQKY